MINFTCSKTKAVLRLSLVFLLLLPWAASATAQLVINEVAAHKEGMDVENYTSDWIELYNSGNETIDLGSYYLSDSEGNPFKWSLPTEDLDPGQRITIFASGKDRKWRIRHWETMVYIEDIWKYIIPDSEPPADWKDLVSSIPDWNSGSGGIGYGDNDDNTVITNALAVYMRHEFSVADTSAIGGLTIHADYDDAYVAYLNGVEIARSWNIAGSPPPYNTSLEGGNEAILYQGGIPEQVFIPKSDLADILEPGMNVLAVQVHNESIFSSDMSSNFTLSMGATDDSFTFGLPPSWFSMPQSHYHTNFKITPGESLFLTNNQGETEDQLLIHPDLSYLQTQGRSPDGSDTWCVFPVPTFDDANTAWCYEGIAEKPETDLSSGFYPTSQTVNVMPTGGSVIRYSLNGDEPTASSPIWSGALNIDTSLVVSLKAFSTGNFLPSAVADYSYFIEENSQGLPVFSLITDHDNMWDWFTGIYVSGPNAQFWYPFFGSNFWEPWSKWSRLQYFDAAGDLRAETTLDLEIHGGWSRAEDQRSFRFDMKSMYDGDLEFPLIADKPYVAAFNNINVRNGGQHVFGTRIQDAFCNRLIRDTHVDYCAYHPVMTFLNGDFFGINGIREKIDEQYVEDNYLIPKESVDLMNSWNVLAGSDAHFIETTNTILGMDPTDPELFGIACSRFDIENYIDYFIAETYCQNLDWMGIAWGPNNIKLWRPQIPEGKWRYVTYDMDACFGYFGNNPWENFINSARYPSSPNSHSLIFNQLCQNEQFIHRFVNRYADLINTIFQPAHFDDLLYSMRLEIANAMPDQIERWNLPESSIVWNDGINGISNFNDIRVGTSRDHINTEFGLDGQQTVELNVNPAEAGRIKISTITPSEYPWTGIYFNGCPVEITAIANPGYTFSHWQANQIWDENNTDITVIENISEYTHFTAVFEGEAVNADVRISEVNYNSHNSHDSGDWIEIHNNSNVPVDISEWVLTDIYATLSFDFPMGTILPPQGYLVLVSDESKFVSQYPEVSNYMAALQFDLDNGGEYIALRNHFGANIVEFEYSDNFPWPQGADGMGRTLEKAENVIYSSPEGWFDGCMFGSPGEAFEPCNDPVVISEIHYHPSVISDGGDWIELTNTSDEELEVSGWIVRDEGLLNQFIIPMETTIASGERLIIAQNVVLFDSVYACHNVGQVVGPLGFGLDNGGEMLGLFSPQLNIVESCYYNDGQGWPQSPDGEGPSLEREELQLPPNADNWFAGCNMGSPGTPFDPDCTSGIQVSILQDGNELSADVFGGTGTYNYQWFLNGELVGEDSTFDVTTSGNYQVVVTDESGCVGISSIDELDVGNAESGKLELLASPNPATTQSTITTTSDGTGWATLYDSLGRIARKQMFSGNTFTIARQDLSTGIYTLEVDQGGQKQLLKISFR